MRNQSNPSGQPKGRQAQAVGRVSLFLLGVGLLLGNTSSLAEEKPADESPAWVDLLPQIQPATHVVAGTWNRQANGLQVNSVVGARLWLPWVPVAEYDYEVRFTRRTGTNSIALMFVAGGKQASLDLDGWNENLGGIQNIAGQTIRENPTRVPDLALENGRRYTALLRVRKDRVEALLDGKLICTYRGDGSDLSLVDLWDLRQPQRLGLGAWQSEALFESIRVRPLSSSSEAAKPMPVVSRPMPPDPPSHHTPRNNQADELAALSDEFDRPETLRNWKRVFQTEQAGADQLAVCDINQSQRGWLTLIPHASSWYQDYRGVLLYKEIEGDFVISTRVQATNRAGTGPPASNFSLAGIMIRTPRDVTPRTWRPGQENYIFLSIGAAATPRQYAFEVKTTINSDSQLEITPAPGPEARILVGRIGADFVLLRQAQNQNWEVHRRYRRPDMPTRLQVGLAVYTDYNTISRMQPPQHNTTVNRGGSPDLRARFDYVRFARPVVPAALQGRSFADPQQVSDAQILELLAEHLR